MMEFVSYFFELRVIYYDFFKPKTISKMINDYWKKENHTIGTRGSPWVSGPPAVRPGATRLYTWYRIFWNKGWGMSHIATRTRVGLIGTEENYLSSNRIELLS
jgi:hypothetical protein